MLGDKKDQALSFEKKNRFQICRNTAKIFEELKKRKININFANREQQSTVSRRGKDYEIHQGMMTKNGISPKTRLERCLSHIAFDSPVRSFTEKIKPTLMTKIPMEYEKEADKVLESIFDAFEDRRTQSNYGVLYPGALERFQDARQVDAKERWEGETPKPTDPVSAIQMASLDQTEALEGSDFKDATEWMKLVEHTGKRGSLMLTKKFWNEIAEPWFLDYIQQIQEQRENEQEGNSEGDGKGKGKGQPDPNGKSSPDGQPNPNGQPSEDDGDGQQDEQSQSGKGSGGGNPSNNQSPNDPNPQDDKEDGQSGQSPPQRQDSEDMKDDFEDAINDMVNNMPKDHDDFEEDQQVDDVGDSLEMELDAGKDEIEKIEEQLSEMKGEPDKDKWDYNDFKGHIVKRETYSNEDYTVNRMVARQLSRMFRKIKGQDAYEIDQYGSEIDIDAFIDKQIVGYGEFMKNEKNSTGFDIVIGVDESGSMGGHPIQIVRDMVATLYTALELTPQVTLKVIGWQDSYRSCEIHEVTKIEEVANIQSGGGTPLAEGTWHCKKVLENMRGRRKVFFQITDGEPNDHEDIAKTKEAVRIMRRKGIICHGIYIGGGGSENMKEIFGKESYKGCETVEEVSTYLTRELTRKIAKHLQRAC